MPPARRLDDAFPADSGRAHVEVLPRIHGGASAAASEEGRRRPTDDQASGLLFHEVASERIREPNIDFDGADRKKPLGTYLLERIREKEMELSLSPVGLLGTIGELIRDSKSMETAAQNLRAWNLLPPGKIEPVELRFGLSRVWYEAAPHTRPNLEIDRAWPLPTVKLEKGGVTYFIHGVVHPEKIVSVPPHQTEVLNLVRRLRSGGLPLYSEFGFTRVFGYDYGRVIDDRTSVAQVLDSHDLQPKGLEPRPLSMNGKVISSVLTLGIPMAFFMHNPDSVVFAGLLTASILYNYLFWKAFEPIRRASLLLQVGMYAFQEYEKYWYGYLFGNEGDLSYQKYAAGHRHEIRYLADYLHDAWNWSRSFFAGRLDPDVIRRARLPFLESRFRSTRFGERAAKIGSAIASDARMKGYREVHVLTGINHMEDVAWQLP